MARPRGPWQRRAPSSGSKAELISERRLRIDAVQLEQFNPFDPQAAQCLLDLELHDISGTQPRIAVAAMRQ